MLDYSFVSTNGSVPDLGALANASVLAFDTETSGVNVATDAPLGFSLASGPNSAYYTYMSNRFFLDLLADESKLKVCHNGKFDRSMLKKFRVTVNNLCCTMIASHLLEENRLSLEVLLKRYIKGYDLDIKFFKDFGKPIQHATLQEMANHFGPHSAATLALWNVLQRELRANNLWRVFWDIEMPLVPVLSDMELDGAMIDTKVLSELGAYYDERISALEEAMFELAGRRNINFNSADQAADVLYEQFKVPKPPVQVKALWTEEGRPTVDKSYLGQFKGDKFPVVNVYLLYKMYRHLKDTYVDGILGRLVNGRIHTSFNQTRTRTGRLSSTDPNLQNVPMRTEEGRKIRRAFVAPEGKKIVGADMDQVELRKMACLSNCKALLDAFRDGRDVHTEAAIRAYGDPNRRADGKTLNFKCLPLYYKAVTYVGLKGYGELKEGDITLAYDEKTRTCRWTPVRQIVHYDDVPLIRIGNSRVSFDCTPNHRWQCFQRHDNGYSQALVEAKDCHYKSFDGMGLYYSVLLAAPCEGGGIDITEDEARIISWLHTDGSFGKSEYVGAPSQAGGKKVTYTGQIFQTKQPQLDEIRALLKREDASTGSEGVSNSGCTCITLKSEYLRRLWKKSYLDAYPLEQLVTRLSVPARKAMLDTIMKAEGCAPNKMSQNVGPVLRAMSLLLFLEGYYPSIADAGSAEYPKGRTVCGCMPYVTFQRLKSKRIPNAPVWCIETDYHTWVAEDSRSEGDKIFITGNTIYGGGTREEQDLLFKIYPEVKAWTDSMSREFEVLGYARTHHGRKRHLGNFERMSPKEVAHACREGISTMDQGSCAEYLKTGMRKVWDKVRDSDVKMLLQVHDELVFECPTSDVPELAEVLKRNLPYNELQIPLTVSVSVGDNWADAVKIGGRNGR